VFAECRSHRISLRINVIDEPIQDVPRRAHRASAFLVALV
jgi:hypothetical protein